MAFRKGVRIAKHHCLNTCNAVIGVVPPAWVRAMTTADASHLRFGAALEFAGYGYQTWLIDPRRPYFALLGIRGQGNFVDPVTKVVAVFVAAHAA